MPVSDCIVEQEISSVVISGRQPKMILLIVPLNCHLFLNFSLKMKKTNLILFKNVLYVRVQKLTFSVCVVTGLLFVCSNNLVSSLEFRCRV